MRSMFNGFNVDIFKFKSQVKCGALVRGMVISLALAAISVTIQPLELLKLIGTTLSNVQTANTRDGENNCRGKSDKGSNFVSGL